MIHLVSLGAQAFKMTGDSSLLPDLQYARNYEPFVLTPKPNESAMRFGIKHRTSGSIIQTSRTIDEISIDGKVYEDVDEFFKALSLFLIGDTSGVATGEYEAILSDTVDLPKPGWMQPLLLGGTVKYITEEGEEMSRPMELKETSFFKVRRVWVTGTTVGMGIRIIY